MRSQVLSLRGSLATHGGHRSWPKVQEGSHCGCKASESRKLDYLTWYKDSNKRARAFGVECGEASVVNPVSRLVKCYRE
jgi:hypothetical protein